MAFKGESFQHAIYFAHGASGTGNSASDAKPMVDAAIFDIEPGMVITDVSVAVTTAITGTTQVDVGDGTDPNGFVAAATLTDGAVTASNGAYLNNAGAHLEKLYEVADTIDLDITTASTAGAFVVFVRGWKI
jgi:hypothetical protein